MKSKLISLSSLLLSLPVCLINAQSLVQLGSFYVCDDGPHIQVIPSLDHPYGHFPIEEESELVGGTVVMSSIIVDENGNIHNGIDAEISTTVDENGNVTTRYFWPANSYTNQNTYKAAASDGYTFSHWMIYQNGTQQKDLLGSTLTIEWIFHHPSREMITFNENILFMTPIACPDEAKPPYLVTIVPVFKADTDGDGLDDSVETNTGIYISENDTGTDPLNADTSGDGLQDGFVVSAGFDPTVNFSPLLANRYRPSQFKDLRPGSTILEVQDGQASLILNIEESTDLHTWTEGGESKIQIPINANEATKFFRFAISE